jgi:F5/8 type C domain.
VKKAFLTLAFIITLIAALALGVSASSTDLATAAPGRTFLSDKVKTDTIVGTDSFDNEVAENLFDGDTSTKFCTDVFPAEITWQLDTSYIVDAIVFCTANDNESYTGRNPGTWILSGSPDGSNYTVLHQGTASDFADVNFTYFLIEFSNNIAYPYYKLEVPGPETGTVLQISEFVLCAKKVADTTYPSSGKLPATGHIITGTLIGNETGWGDSATSGRDAAFDGNSSTYFDPLGVGDGFCGIDCGEPYTLTQVNILSRDGYLDRFTGAEIQGSNDQENWTTLYTSAEAAAAFDWTVIPASELEGNTGYRYYRYFNETSHGDVAEVEFYGLSVSGKTEADAAVAETVAQATADTAAVSVPAAETVTAAPATADNVLTLSVLAIVLSGMMFAVYTKKRRNRL